MAAVASLYISHYVYRDEPVWRLEAKALFRRYLPGLAADSAGFDEIWVDRAADVSRSLRAADRDARLSRALAPLGDAAAGSFLATMSQVYPEDRGTNYAVRIGRAAAERALAFFDGSRANLPRKGDRATRSSTAPASLHP